MIGTVKISQLPTAETLTGSENLIVNQSGDTRLSTVNDVIGLVPESGVGIQSSGTLVGSAITTLNFIGAGNTFSVDGSTVNISIQGGGGETYWVSNEAGIHTTSSVGIGTTNPTSELHVVGDINLDDGGTYSTTLQMVTATANRTISFPDATGTVALVAGSSGQLTYNNAGSLAGAPTLTYDGSILTSSGRFINSYNATASSPAKVFTGSWFTGGTATTTKPQLLIEPSGTTSTAWSTNGTGLGVNAASGFAGNLLDLQVNGTSQFNVLSNGVIYLSGNKEDSSGACIRTNKYRYTGIGWDATGYILELKSAGVNVLLNQNQQFIFSDPRWQIGFSPTSGGTPDLWITRDAANTLAQRNDTNSQTFRLYNTYTDASNYERTSITRDSSGLVIDAQKGGTGVDPTNLLDLQVGGSSRFKVSPTGDITFNNATLVRTDATSLVFSSSDGYQRVLAYSLGDTNASVRIGDPGLAGDVRLSLAADAAIGWCSSAIVGTPFDLILKRDAAGILAQRNATNAQTYRLYNTYTDGSNYERHTHSWSGNVLNIANEAAGSGTLRGIAFGQNGTDSTPPVTFTGSWFTGGTATTTKPQLLIEPSGTTSTAWSTDGTGLGVNAASGFSGNLLDLQVNGSPKFQVSNSWVTFDTTFGIRGSNYTSANGTNMTVGPGSKVSDSASGTATIKAGNAFPNATTNIVGGALYLTGGSGASNSLGTANGGDINLDGGQSYGTGTEGNIVIGATRGNLVITDARDVILGTTTGTKIGTDTTQKLGFYNATPVVQPTAVADATDAASVITQLNALLDRMRDLGLIAT